MEKEAKFMASIKAYIAEHGVEDFYEAKPPKTKSKFFHVALPKVKDVDVEEFEEEVQKSVKKHRSLYERFKTIDHVDWLIHRYDVLKFLSNISLSVHPKIKDEYEQRLNNNNKSSSIKNKKSKGTAGRPVSRFGKHVAKQ
jgi:uncharacterized protein YlbG (UPF0298 family)